MNTVKPKHGTSEAISLADEDAVKDLMVNTVFNLWDVVNNLTRLRPSRRPFYRVSIFGSARTEADSPVYQQVKQLATELTKLGCDIITGGGPGLMQAANEGSKAGNLDGKQRSMGIRITLPFEQSMNEYVEKGYEHQTFFTRLHHFVLASDAFIVVPGGIGTVLEMFMVWQLLQVKHLEPMPLILVGEMYKELVDWGKKHMLASTCKLVNAEDMEIPICVTTPDEAVAIISNHRALWSERQHRT